MFQALKDFSTVTVAFANEPAAAVGKWVVILHARPARHQPGDARVPTKRVRGADHAKAMGSRCQQE